MRAMLTVEVPLPIVVNVSRTPGRFSRRILGHGLGDGAGGLERGAGRHLDRDRELRAILVGHELRRHAADDHDRERERREGPEHGQPRKAQRLANGPRVAVLEPIEAPVEGAREEELLLVLVLWLHHPGRERGREREADQHREQHGDADHDAELEEEAADQAGHVRDRHEHRDDRQGRGDDGEADLVGRLAGRLHAWFAHLHVAVDIFDHDDRVIDQDADRERERQHRDVVEREAQPVHPRRRSR